MKRRRFSRILTSMSLTALFVLTALTPITAQTVEDRMKTIRAMREAENNKPEFGWLILDGEYIPGPYEFEVTDSAILINGLIVVAPPPKAKETKEKTYDSVAVARSRLEKAFLDSLANWRTWFGLDSAGHLAENFMLNQAVIETAFLASETDLRVSFRGYQYEERWNLASLVPESSEDKKSKLRDRLEIISDRIKAYLFNAGLVLMQDGRFTGIGHPRSAVVFDELKEIAETIPDLDQRIEAVERATGDRKRARKIAEHFMQQ
jgi:hypothetical protein